MDDSILELEMARRFYGYGRWDAPHWFVGLEEGKGRNELPDNAQRVNAWDQLGRTELCDCLEFHYLIGEKDFHKERPILQHTWRPIILLLKTFLGDRSDKDSFLRAYQRDRWGRVNGGVTCVIEMTGSAAKSLDVPKDRERFQPERIEGIHYRMLKYKPRLMVIYGGGRKKREGWEKILGSRFGADGVMKLESTIVAHTPQPAAHILKDTEWEALGRKLRAESWASRS
jgi:hypothetical protein